MDGLLGAETVEPSLLTLPSPALSGLGKPLLHSHAWAQEHLCWVCGGCLSVSGVSVLGALCLLCMQHCGDKNSRCRSEMNVQAAWKRGYTGKNVVVTILDDGIERNHPDLAPNYVSRTGTDMHRHSTTLVIK